MLIGNQGLSYSRSGAVGLLFKNGFSLVSGDFQGCRGHFFNIQFVGGGDEQVDEGDGREMGGTVLVIGEAAGK